MKCRVVTVVRQQARAIFMCDDKVKYPPCKGLLHSARIDIQTWQYTHYSQAALQKSHPIIKCETCGIELKGDDCSASAGMEDVYSTEDGKLHPGDMYLRSMGGYDWPDAWVGTQHRQLRSGQDHLVVMLPNGSEWDIDGQDNAQSGGWRRIGEPPLVTVEPSILTGDYHGFLRNGEFVPA